MRLPFSPLAFTSLIQRLLYTFFTAGLVLTTGGCNILASSDIHPPPTEMPPPPAAPTFIQIEATPTPPPTPQAAVPPEPIWVINVMDGTLVQIDPAVNEVVGGFKPDGVPMDVVSGQAGVWVIARMTDKMVNILQIDPQIYRVAGILPLQLEDVRGLTLSENAVWAAAARMSADGITPLTTEQGFAGDLIRIDPSTHSITALLPLTAIPKQVIFQEDALWVLEDAGVISRFTRIDPATQQNFHFPLSNPTMDYIYQLSRFARCDSSMWGLSVDSRSRFIYRIDPKDGQLNQIIPLGTAPDDNPLDLVTTMQSVWVALRSRSIVEIDPKTNQVSRRIPLTDTPDRIFSADGSIWVQSHTGASLTRIDPTSGEVLAEINTGSKLRPTSTPWPELSPGEVCQGDYPTHLTLYGRAMVSPDPPVPNRVRSEPNLGAEILGEIQPGQGMTIIEGPVCTDGWIWWKVQADNTNLIGWTAEGDGDSYWLVPN
ncbi:MAG: SH3 domain-containing protein [Anaerolineae bacterium]|nr:SH3 domain-containing protein [Anaerolineae bacterium]